MTAIRSHEAEVLGSVRTGGRLQSELRTLKSRTIVMLTADRKIDRRILLEADTLESAGWQVTIIAMPLDQGVDDDVRILRVGVPTSISQRGKIVLNAYRSLRRFLSMNNWLRRAVKAITWRYLIDQEEFYLRFFLKRLRNSLQIFL